LSPLFSSLKIIEPISEINVCWDPDDDKFIECAVDSRAIYIVSGDKDLLDIQEYDGIQIITAKEFCDTYLH
jgi:putative PIN family toxin of toxin-antitoxin system